MHETEDFINEQLIKVVKCYPALYTVCSIENKNNEAFWDDVQKKIGIHKSWLKKRWNKIINDYKQINIYNHIHSKKTSTFKWAKLLNFIPIDLNGTADIIVDDFISNKIEKAFHITQQMLDECDINETVTLETVTKCKSSKEYEEYQEDENDTIPKEQYTLKKSLEIGRIDKPTATYERCEDSIFGELVVAMLKKLEPEEKKRAKKEIMNILL